MGDGAGNDVSSFSTRLTAMLNDQEKIIRHQTDVANGSASLAASRLEVVRLQYKLCSHAGGSCSIKREEIEWVPSTVDQDIILALVISHPVQQHAGDGHGPARQHHSAHVHANRPRQPKVLDLECRECSHKY